MSAAPAAEIHRDPGGPPAILTEGVDDAQLLLAYAAEHGKGIDVETAFSRQEGTGPAPPKR